MNSFILQMRRDTWLSQLLGRDVYGLTSAPASEAAGGATTPVPFSRSLPDDEQGLDDILAISPVFVFARVLPQETKTLAWLECRGFNLVDTNLLFSKPAERSADTTISVTTRLAEPDDEAETVHIALSGFTYSRFHMDHQLQQKEADRIKAEWTRNYFKGQRGDKMVVAEDRGHIIGFLLLLHDEMQKVSTIDLIATAPHYRRRRVGEAMIRFAEREIEACERIRVGTQLANTPSIRLYQRLGFTVESASYVLHYHH